MLDNPHTPYSPVVLTDNQEQQRLNQKRWNTAYKLWKLKSSQPHLFANLDRQLDLHGRDALKAPDGLPGFEPARLPNGDAAPGWQVSSERHIFREEASNRLLWLDSTSGVYQELHHGDDWSAVLALSGVATTAMTPSSSSSRAKTRGGSPSASGVAMARHLAIMDLHKAAEVFKFDLDHIDRPAAMLAVYKPAEDAVSPEVAAKCLHERLLRRLAASRSRLSGEALQMWLIESTGALAAEQQAAGIAGAVALILGQRLVVAVAGGAACAVADSLPGDMRDIRVAASSSPRQSTDGGAAVGSSSSAGATCTACVDLDSRSAACVLLHTEGIMEEGARIAATHVTKGHLRAGAIALMHESPGDGATDQVRAAACARLSWTLEAVDEPQVKRSRTGEKGKDKVRCRQILFKYLGCKHPTDPVRRRPVRRTLAEAEAAMLRILDALEESVAGGGAAAVEAAFTQHCRAVSECTASLKGGDLAGDIGWLKLPEVKPGEKLSKDLAAKAVVIRAALSLEIGEVSDIVVSEEGVHLLKRSA